MPTIDNTDRAAKAAKVLNGKQTEYVIRGVKGLRLHVQPSGEHRWYFHYWLREGSRRKHKAQPLGYADLGASSKDKDVMSRAEAVRRAVKALHAVGSGQDPVGERQAEDRKHRRGESFKTLDELVEAWLTKAIRGKHKTAEDTERRYRRHVQRALGGRRPEEIERREVIELIDTVSERGGHEANRVQHLVHAIYGWAISEGHLKNDPTYRLKYRHKEEPRQRALSPPEIKAIWHGLDLQTFTTASNHRPISQELRDIYRLLMLLGQRKMEVARMERCELALDGEMPVWTIPGARTKNGVTHRVPLPPLALGIIREALGRTDSEYVFPCWETLRPYSPVGVGSVSRLLRTELKLGNDIRVHDFRRTMGTQMAALRVSAEDRARVMNHVRGAKTNTTTKVYDVYAYDDEKLRALATWEVKLKTIVGYDSATNVLRFAAPSTANTLSA